MHLNKKNKKFSITLLLAVFLLVLNFNFVCMPKQVHAQTTDFSNLALNTAKWIWEKITLATEFLWQRGGSVAFQRALRSFSNQLAYKAADQIATGKAGGGVAWFTKLASEEAQKAGEAAGAEFLDNLASGYGINICEPPTANLKFNLAIGLKQTKVAGELKPRCTLDEMTKKWGDFATQLKNPTSIISLNDASLMDLMRANGLSVDAQKSILTSQERREMQAELLSRSISMEDSDLSYITDTTQKIEEDMKKAEDSSVTNRNANSSATGIRTAITGELITPAEITAENLKEINKRNADVKTTGDIMVDTANIFLNTLVSKSLDNLMKNLLKQNPPQSNLSDSSNLTGSGSGSYSGNRASVIDEIFSTINRISININPREINLISELEMDLGDEFVGKMNNKTIDSKFADVLRRSETEPVTLKEAIDQSLIDGDKYFGYINISGINNQPALDDGYSYDNIKKLRKNRIVPVGWEFAALKVAQLDPSDYPEGCDSRGCKLSAIVNGYEKTGTFRRGSDIIKDNYCGYRSVSLAPYNIKNTSSTNCNAGTLGVDPTTVDVKWIGGAGANGQCIKYSVIDGVVNSKEIDLGLTQEGPCIGSYGVDFYHEWIPGGCVVKEKNESPFCRLVDPNWVLKAPKQQCVSEGYYSSLESSDSSSRYKDCADTKNCLKEDDNGNCLGWGYCLKEKNIWKFRGKKCDEKSAGCTTLKDDSGKEKSYILDTLKSCPQDEVGCKEYANTKIDIDTTDAKNYVWATSTFKYFNSSVSSCESNNDGCTKFLEIAPGLNLVSNGGFEIDEDENGFPDGWWHEPEWQNNAGSLQVGGAYSGAKYFKYTSGTNPKPYFWMPVKISNAGLYTLSYYVKGSGSVTANFKLNSSYYIKNAVLTFGGNTNDQWERKSGYLYITEDMLKLSNITPHVSITNLSGNVDIDAVQFELNSFSATNTYCAMIPPTPPDIAINFNCAGVGNPSVYSEYGASSNVFLKKAPDYYNCKTQPENENCSNYAKYCTKDNVGCEAYRPTNGDQTVFSIVSQSDPCPSVCNNYQTFSQYPSYFEYIEDFEDNQNSTLTLTDTNFIPETAKDCSPANESCELFTNIDKVNKGGEGKEYYSYLRQCVKPTDVDTTIYYTWEGSDTSGFQLKTWKLLKSQLSDNAPCTNVRIGTNNCIDSASNNTLITNCDPSLNMDCRIFYDKNGTEHKRLLSRTVPITDECVELRREASGGSSVTYKAVLSMSTKCDAKNVGCRRYKGNKGDNIRNVLFENFESAGVAPWSNTISGGEADISNESTVYNGHSMVVYSTVNHTVSIEYNLTQNGDTLIPGKRYTLDFWAKSSNDNNPNYHQGATGGAQQENNRAEGPLNFNPIKLFKAHALAVNDFEFGSTQQPARLEDNEEWLQYKYESRDFEISTNGELVLKFYIKLPSHYKTFFIDNINLKEVTSDFYKIKDSWATPRVCSDGNYLRCQKYLDRDNNPWYFYKFTNTCDEANVGCSAMIDTKNSEMPFKQTFNAYCNSSSTNDACDLGSSYYKNYSDVNAGNRVGSTIIIPEDELVYIVKQRKDLCTSANKGCRAFGFKGDDGKYNDVYKIDNPDNYIQEDYYGSNNKTLCLSEFMDCTAFSVSGGGTISKIHPRDRICEYKEASGESLAGYYEVNNPSVSCDNKIYNENYNSLLDDMSYVDNDWSPFGNYKSSYSLACNKNQDKCSMFIDPTDTVDMSVEATNITNQSINFATNSWLLGAWNGGGFSLFSFGSFSFSNSSLSFPISTANNSNVIVYRGPNTSLSPFAFSVKENAVYKLSANVKFNGLNLDDKEYISTFLSCRSTADSGLSGYVKGSLVNGYMPYAFPFTKSNHFVEEKDTSWHQIDGLYKILPGAKYCNVAFYVYGKNLEPVLLKDIKFEEVTGNYYYIDNSELDRKSCSKADFEDGCVLFNNISKGNLSYNSFKSYESGSLVGNNTSYPNDSNELLKVVRDRECGEWDACSSKITTKDYQGNDKSSCVALMACDKLSSSGDCANYLPKDPNEKALNLDKYYSNMGLGTWSNMSYSGYSMPGAYAPHDLSAYSVLESVSNYNNTQSASTSINKLGFLVKKGPYLYKQGVTYTNPLVTNADSFAANNIAISNTEASCRLYPEKDSPFNWTKNNKIVLDSGFYTSSTTQSKYAIITGIDSAFQNANISQPMFGVLKDGLDILGPGQSSDCNYTRADYGSQSLFFPYEANNIPQKINIISDNNQTSTLNLKRSVRNMGWNGFCMEYDKSLFINTNYSSSYNDPNSLNYRCLSWYPVDIIGGGIESSSYAPEADVSYNQIPENGKMCLVADDYTIPGDRIYCAVWSSNAMESAAGLFGTRLSAPGGFVGTPDDEARCNVVVKIPAGTKIKKDGMTPEFFNYIENSYMSSSEYEDEWINENNKDYNIIYGADWPQWYQDNVYNNSEHLYSCYSYGSGSTNWWQEKEKKFTQNEFNYNPNTAIVNKSFIDEFKASFTGSIDFFYYDEGVSPEGMTGLGSGPNFMPYEWQNPANTGYTNDYEGGGGISESYGLEPHFYISVGNATLGYQESGDGCRSAGSAGYAYGHGCVNAANAFGYNNNQPNAHEVMTNCYSGDDGNTASIWNPLQYNYYVHYDGDNRNQYFRWPIATQYLNPSNYTDYFYTHLNSSGINCGENDMCLQRCKTVADIKTTGENRTIFRANNIYLASIPVLDIANTAPSSTDVWGDYCKIGNPIQEVCPLMVSGNESHYNIEKRIKKDQVWINQSGSYKFAEFSPDFAVSVSNESIADIGRKPILVSANGSPINGASIFTFYASSSTLSVAQYSNRIRNWIVKIPSQNIYNVPDSGNATTGGSTWDFTDVGAIDPSIKSVSNSGMGGNGFSINSSYGSDITVSDSSSNFVVDMTFYAYANENQTPIREIKVCWNGDNDCFDFKGIFKNRKNKCQRFCGSNYTSAIMVTNLKPCSTNADCNSGEKCFAKTWGDTEEACIEDSENSKQYFKFSNVYVCSPMSSAWSPDCGGSSTKGCCIYKPRLTITDNWGKSTTGYMCSTDTCSIKVYPQ